MIKIVIASRRNPLLSRTDFLDHLRNVHWPIVRGAPTVLSYLKHYTQNHVIEPTNGLDLALPYPLFEERDSVIELGFDSMDALAAMSALPEYLERVRPDEARFNDLANIVATPCTQDLLYSGTGCGRITRFEFINRRVDVTLHDFRSALDRTGKALSLDPLYRAYTDQRIHYVAMSPNDQAAASNDGWGGAIKFDAIIATRASCIADFEFIDTNVSEEIAELVDRSISRSLLTSSFLMHEQ